MPGLVIASRRWIIGSDDVIIPGVLLSITHFIWIIVYCFFAVKNGTIFLTNFCSNLLTYHVFGQLVLIVGCTILELCIIKISLIGSILNTKARLSIIHLLYIRFALFVIEVIWEGFGLTIFLSDNKIHCSPQEKDVIIGLKCYDICIWVVLLCIVWCSFDPAGKSWVKMKKFQESLKDENSKFKYRRSQNSQRNWRHREAVREYEKSWNNRFRKLCCIFNLNERRDNSFAEIAKLLSEFFRDLDVVPSDVVAGLSLMRVQQKAERREKINDSSDKTFQFLSGVSINSETKFLDLTHPLVVKEMFNILHYFHYSMAIYGWPMYIMANSPTNWCKLLNHTKFCGNQSCNFRSCIGSNLGLFIGNETVIDESYIHNLENDDYVLGDNCCLCNRAAIKQTCIDHNYKIIYITYHVAIEKTPFFVAVDYDKMSIVVSIRGTLSPYDVLTDLNAECDLLPVNPPRETWFGHKGMVSAASYIRSELVDKHIIHLANDELKSKFAGSSEHFPIIIVGHSLGAGTAAILAVLLREIYSNVICFAFAPPGGLLSEEAAEYTKDFVVSVVYAKDIVPRVGLHQMEKLRHDLINSIKQCNLAKWGIIFKSCCIGKKDISMEEFVEKFNIKKEISPKNTVAVSDEEEFKKLSIHPNDKSISLTVHTPLYPPGSIIHLVRTHPNRDEKIISKEQTIVQALWSNNKNFNEIIISPTMVKDHMPDTILNALECLLKNTGPPKPQRLTDSNAANRTDNSSPSNESDPSSSSTNANIIVETSFTDAHNDNETEFLNEIRLKRLKSLVRKGYAPIATPETVSLSSSTEPSHPAPFIPKTMINKEQTRDNVENLSIKIDDCDDQNANLKQTETSPIVQEKSFSKSLSDSNLKHQETKFGHLKRSHEKYFLNNLDSSITIFED